MIYFCADDYGLCDSSSDNIIKCVQNGVLNKISVFPNFDFKSVKKVNENVMLSLHINLVEGKCTTKDKKLDLLTDNNGVFRHSFAGLMLLSLIHPKKMEQQLYIELKSQILLWKQSVSKDEPIMIDSHQHTHMIPLVFKTLLKVIKDENISIKYLRIPAEPVKPYLMTPSIYHTYSLVNIIKQWLLKFLNVINKKEYKKHKIPTANFFGILFSGNMDKKRVQKVLPHYIKLAKKHNCDIEVLFHPGYCNNTCQYQGMKFNDFYFSKGRKTEFDTLMSMDIESITERSAF